MKILFVLVLGILLVLVGCSQVDKPDSLTSETQIPTVITIIPEPIPIPVLSEFQNVIDEYEMVTELLTLFNNAGNNYIRFLQATNDIYYLQGSMLAPEESQYQISYVASKMTLFGLIVYGDAIRNWNPPEESNYYGELIDIKEAELYRIEYFGGLTEAMLTTLQTEDSEAINVIHEEFLSWRDNPLNQKPMNLQHSLLTELEIHPDEVNFKYIMPEKPLPTLPPVFGNDENQTVG